MIERKQASFTWVLEEGEIQSSGVCPQSSGGMLVDRITHENYDVAVVRVACRPKLCRYGASS